MSKILQLAKGVTIGIVLLLAIIGLIDLFQDDSADQVQRKDDVATADTPTAGNTGNRSAKSIEAPSFSINRPSSPETSRTSSEDGQVKTEVLVSEQENKKLDQQAESGTATPDNSVMDVVADRSANPSDETVTETTQSESEAGFKPEIVEEPVKYGEISLSAVFIGSGDPSIVDYAVYDTQNRKVAERTDVAVTTLRLPVGEYSVVTRHNGKTQKQRLIVSENKLTAKRFNIAPAITTGILQVAAITDHDSKAVKTRFTIHGADGELVASRDQVSSTFFKLEAGNYRVTAGDESSNSSKNIKLEPGDSINHTFRIKPMVQTGTLLVSAVNEEDGVPLPADIVIAFPDGRIVANEKQTTNAEFKLNPGTYRVRVTGANGQSARNIKISANQQLAEMFQFRTVQPSTSENQSDSDPSPVENAESQVETEQQTSAQGVGKLMLKAVNAESRQSVRSNFYVQRPNGTHVDKKIYASSAEFDLPPGEYKITVRSNGMSPVIRQLAIRSDTRLNQIVTLYPENREQSSQPGGQTTPSAVKETQTNPAANPPENGELIVSMQNGTQKKSRNSLLTTFLIDTKQGKRVAAIDSVQNATVRLDVGDYIVTAIHKGSRQDKRITIRNNRVTRLDFNSRDFQRPEGVLISRVIDVTGQPLKGNISIINRRGHEVRRANNVSRAEFNLPPREFTVRLEYEGLSGSERVRIRADETTMQTFTVAPDQAAPRQRDTNDRIRDKIREELRRIIR